jgi:Skp family chaperone for outer membrane proteins
MKRICILICVLVFAVTAMGKGNNEKIAIVDMSRVVSVFPETETIEATLRDQVEDFGAERKKIEEKAEGMRLELEALAKEAGDRALSDEAREAKKRDITGKYKELQRYQFEMRKQLSLRKDQLNDATMRMRKRLSIKVRDIVGEYAKDKGYTLVLDSAVIVYNVDKMDITEGVVKHIQKQKK